MERKILGTVVSVKKQWWLKVNAKPVRMNALDGVSFPHIIKVRYVVDGKEYFIKKWIRACDQPPAVGTKVTVCYDEKKPRKSKLF